MQPRILYRPRLSFRMDGEKKSFQDRQKVKEYVTTKSEIIKGGGSIKEKRPQEQYLESNRDNLQKKGLYRQYDGTKFISFKSYSQCEQPKCSHEMAQGFRLDKKTGPSICCLRQTHFEPKDTSRLKVRGWRNIYGYGSQKKAGVAILISDKLDF